MVPPPPTDRNKKRAERGQRRESKASKTWQQSEETVARCWLVSAKQAALEVFCHGKVLVHCDPLWAGECCSGARPSPHALGLMGSRWVLCSASEVEGLPRSTTRTVAHAPNTRRPDSDSDSRELGCVRLQKNTPVVLTVPGACSGSGGRNSRPVRRRSCLFSILYCLTLNSRCSWLGAASSTFSLHTFTTST